MANIYKIHNGPAPTTAAQATVTTGTSIKTMLQIKLNATAPKGVISAWGISFDGSAAATPIKVELIETGTVFATVTAHVAAGIVKTGDPDAANPTTTIFDVGTTSTGFTSTSEGSISASRVFDAELVAPTNQYVMQFPLGREPKLNNSTSIRIRVTAGAAVNCYCWIEIDI